MTRGLQSTRFHFSGVVVWAWQRTEEGERRKSLCLILGIFFFLNMTCYMWPMTHDTWHVTFDIGEWHRGSKPSLKISASDLVLIFRIFWIFFYFRNFEFYFFSSLVFYGFITKLIRLLLKVTKVTTGNQKWAKTAI